MKPQTTQSVRYHSLSDTTTPPSMLRPATNQARLHGVLGRKSMYIGQWSRIHFDQCILHIRQLAYSPFTFIFLPQILHVQ
jgi:hypothetical protein